jgi:hypothetical protein
MEDDLDTEFVQPADGGRGVEQIATPRSPTMPANIVTGAAAKSVAA